MKFGGNDQMAGMMNKMGGMSINSVVTAISTDSLPDSLFEIPAGYTTVNK